MISENIKKIISINTQFYLVYNSLYLEKKWHISCKEFIFFFIQTKISIFSLMAMTAWIIMVLITPSTPHLHNSIVASPIGSNHKNMIWNKKICLVCLVVKDDYNRIGLEYLNNQANVWFESLLDRSPLQETCIITWACVSHYVETKLIYTKDYKVMLSLLLTNHN